MFTIGSLTKQFKLSRSTLLYYDKIGLLKPSKRTDSNYRLYSNEDVEKLRTIIRHRDAGISLEDISKLLDIEKNNTTHILTERLKNIQNEIKILKKQESMILAVLIEKVKTNDSEMFDRRSWTELLVSLGFSHEDSMKWHRDFERDSSEEHEAFLHAIGMSEEEIKKLRLLIVE